MGTVLIKPKHILLGFIIFAIVLLLVHPPQFKNGQRVIIRKPLPGPKWLWELFTAIELGKWK